MSYVLIVILVAPNGQYMFKRIPAPNIVECWKMEPVARVLWPQAISVNCYRNDGAKP